MFLKTGGGKQLKCGTRWTTTLSMGKILLRPTFFPSLMTSHMLRPWEHKPLSHPLGNLPTFLQLFDWKKKPTRERTEFQGQIWPFFCYFISKPWVSSLGSHFSVKIKEHLISAYLGARMGQCHVFNAEPEVGQTAEVLCRKHPKTRAGRKGV